MTLATQYVGFDGHLQRDQLSLFQYRHAVRSTTFRQGTSLRTVVQWLRHAEDFPLYASPYTQQDLVLFAGFFPDLSSSRIASLISHLKQGRSHEGAHLPGEGVGCLLSPGRLFLFKSLPSNENIFYRVTPQIVRWSTNPLDLVDGVQDLDEGAIRHCCRGENVFLPRDLHVVPASQLVVIEQERVHTLPFDHVTPFSCPARMSLDAWAQWSRQLLLQAVQPLVSVGRIGILLSGGIDSSAVAAALTLAGANVTAYHFSFADPDASEERFARALCQRLGIPLVAVPVNTGDQDSLSASWDMPHPYSHPGSIWMLQVAQQLHQDGITVLATGRGGDTLFAPATSGLSTVLRSPISLREKGRMLLGALTTDWSTTALLRSLHPAFPVVGKTSMRLEQGQQEEQRRLRRADFLTSVDGEDVPAITPVEAGAFSPQDTVLELSVWQPHGIRVCHPFHHKALLRFGATLPDAYRLLPRMGVKIVKPVLKWAWRHDVPSEIITRQWGSWLDAPAQSFCLTSPDRLLAWLATPESSLMRRGILDRGKLLSVLSDPRSIRSSLL
ncbi:asparagine synthase [Thermosporothrix hazakensis]|uniref:asparagine synthase (glutamine-hydrolyzing) n=2 Tax=Thermosporothrix hazakensis TaxID=644383 RepID=A0A326U506_THEHA|nr:asparagine synthase C-terminal domain-containing protein [Thermosporothrix hazakensis]PZW28342.1 asparagine synthase [Thermosporothrix hazakensis]GCE46299.1 hypothetical protein KTH_11680 [Thermosporothrix hazakensis]